LLICLIIILVLIFALPLIIKPIEQNLEIFLFVMGLLAAVTSGILNLPFIAGVFENKFMYFIVLAVFIGGCLFKASAGHVKNFINKILKMMPVELFVFLLVVIVGVLSSVITAIVAALFLAEIVNLLPLAIKAKIRVTIIACFSIGIGAVLTPIGEPLSTIVVSRLGVDFWYMFRELGCMVIPGIVMFGLIGAYFARNKNHSFKGVNIILEREGYKEIIIRSLKIFLFIISLEFLGASFKPIIDAYVIELNSKCLFWLNMSSAILDNATLASAEISVEMTHEQITAILIGLLVSGGMMIPGNIPNIISAGKLKIKSREWIELGVPLGMIAMVVYFLLIFYL
jgi:predicted cation transporter